MQEKLIPQDNGSNILSTPTKTAGVSYISISHRAIGANHALIVHQSLLSNPNSIRVTMVPNAMLVFHVDGMPVVRVGLDKETNIYKSLLIGLELIRREHRYHIWLPERTRILDTLIKLASMK